MNYKKEKIDPDYGKKVKDKWTKIEQKYIETAEERKHLRTEMRVAEVIDYLLIYTSPSVVLKKLLEEKAEDWNIKSRQMRNLIKEAQNKIKESSSFDKDKEIGKALKRYEKLYQNAYLTMDYKTCKDIVEKMCQMMGLNKPQEINIQAEKLEEYIVALKEIK